MERRQGSRAERKDGRRARAAHAGQRGQILLDPVLERNHVFPFGKELGRHTNPEAEDAFGPETGIDAQQPLEAAHHQPARGEQHERQRHLGHDHAAPQAAVPASAPYGAARKEGRQRGARRPGRRGKSSEQAYDRTGRDRDTGDAPVHGDRLPARQVQGRQRDEGPRGPESAERGHAAAPQPQQRSLEQRCPRDGGPARAQGARDRQLLLALGGPREQDRCEVDHDRQDEEHATESERHQGRPHAGHEVGLQSHRIQSQPAPLEIAAVHGPAHGFHGGGQLLGGGASPRADEARIRSVSRIGVFEQNTKRDEGIGRLRRPRTLVPGEHEAARQDADDLVGPVVQAHLAADDLGIGAESIPQLMRKHHHRRRAWPHFVGREGAPEGWRHAQQVEQRRRREHHRDLDRLALAPDGERVRLAAEAHDLLDDPAGLLKLHDVRPGQHAALQVGDRAVVSPYVAQVVRVLVWHRVDQDPLDDRVDDGGDAQANPECRHRRQDQRRRTPQPADRVLDIAAPVAAAPPRYCWPEPLAHAVAQRVRERPDAHRRQAEGAVAVRLDQRVAHLVAEVGGVEAKQQPEPPLRDGHHVTPAHLVSFGRRPPIRAARINISSRRASVLAARRPASVMR